jgi:hypothetical protein
MTDDINPLIRSCQRIIQNNINNEPIDPKDSANCLTLIGIAQSYLNFFNNLKCSDARTFVDINEGLVKMYMDKIKTITPIINGAIQSFDTVGKTFIQSVTLYNCAVDEINAKYNNTIQHIDISPLTKKEQEAKMYINILIGVIIFLLIIILNLSMR